MQFIYKPRNSKNSICCFCVKGDNERNIVSFTDSKHFPLKADISHLQSYPGYAINISIVGLLREAEDADIQDKVHHVTSRATVRVSARQDHVPQGVHVAVQVLEILHHLEMRLINKSEISNQIR